MQDVLYNQLNLGRPTGMDVFLMRPTGMDVYLMRPIGMVKNSGFFQPFLASCCCYEYIPDTDASCDCGGCIPDTSCRCNGYVPDASCS